MKKYEVKIEGISAYLMHKFGEEESELKTKTGSKDYESEVNKALYQLPDGTIYVPSTQIQGSLIEAGKQMKVVGGGKKTYSKLFGSFVIMEPDVIPMIPQEWVTDKRAVVIPSTKGRVMRYRPRFDKWALKFRVHFHEEEIHPSIIKEGLERAGNYIGIGDFRPSKKGPYGRFMVTLFKEIKKQYIDATRLFEDTGWKAEVGLEDGLKRTVEWYRTFYEDGEYS